MAAEYLQAFQVLAIDPNVTKNCPLNQYSEKGMCNLLLASWKKKYFWLGGHFCQYKQYDTLAHHLKLHILVKVTNGFWFIWSYSISCPLCYWTDSVSSPPSSTDHGGSYSSFNPDSGYGSIPLILLTLFLATLRFPSIMGLLQLHCTRKICDKHIL
jgi:hypothetical protein